MFSEYMKSEENIIYEQDLDSFLNSESAREILLRNYKLGLSVHLLSNVDSIYEPDDDARYDEMKFSGHYSNYSDQWDAVAAIFAK
ncbi:hypothetical protein [Butyrivibrio sp. LC3010]|uniref:hypothetical protein n=1 Tax=Butyrivibrio sp. LC3010 TaxID=1280680 RepID=UPI000405FD0C|nr:hypothetical protein [Butyrivibrio sp. LC3010]